jgi:two-component system chemotaxis response regulator CheY
MDKRALDLRPRAGGTHAVLAASGDPDVRRLLWDTFHDERHRYLVHEEETEDGAVTLAQISRPALVVLDSDLREGSGIEACRRLRADRITRECRIVVISGYATAEERQRALGAGANVFMLKPFSPLKLMALAAQVEGARLAPPLIDWRRAAG